MGNGLGTSHRQHDNSVHRFAEANDDDHVAETESKHSVSSDHWRAPVRRVVNGEADERGSGGDGGGPGWGRPHEPSNHVGAGDIFTNPQALERIHQQGGGDISESVDDLADDGYFTVQERFLYEHDLESMPTKQNAPAEWKQGDVIGSGAFGSVHVALNVDTGELIAVKSVPIFPSSDTDHAKRMRDLRTEIGLMGKLNHPNIVCYLGKCRFWSVVDLLRLFTSTRSHGKKCPQPLVP